jgi:hypothetical protein
MPRLIDFVRRRQFDSVANNCLDVPIAEDVMSKLMCEPYASQWLRSRHAYQDARVPFHLFQKRL